MDLDCKQVIKADVKEDSTIEDWNAYPSINCGVVAMISDGNKNIVLSKWQVNHSDNWIIVDKNGNVLAYGITGDYISTFSDNVAVLKLRVDNKWLLYGKERWYRLFNRIT